MHTHNALPLFLSRFLFHDNTASKVETGVNFPMSLSMPSSDSSSLTEFSLVSCVCHFGSMLINILFFTSPSLLPSSPPSLPPFLQALNSGHYTSYSKQPVTCKWYYYNDETVTEVREREWHSLAIISFALDHTIRQRQRECIYIILSSTRYKFPSFYCPYNFLFSLDSSTFDLPTEKGISFPTQEEELLQLEPLLRALKPKPSAMPPAPPPLPPIKKASSTGN